MLDSPVPCTRPKTSSYTRPLLHFSIALRPDGAGRTGLAVCGTTGVVDQQHLDARPGPRVRLHELRLCRSCRHSLGLLGLLDAARTAHGALIDI